MKYLLVYIAFFTSHLHAQKAETVDSVLYYKNLANTNILVNKYKNAIYYTQKAIDYSEATSNTYHKAVQTFNLGKIYYDLKKNNDAIQFFTESITFFENIPLSESYANAYYYLGLAQIREANYNAAEISLNKSSSIKKELKIRDTNELINLQKAIIYRSKGNLELSKLLLNTIIAKEETPSFLATKTEALYQMGLIEAANNRNNLAINYFNKAYILNSSINNLDQKSNILLALSTVYDKILDKSNAYNYLKLHLNLKESLELTSNERLGIDDYENFKESQRLKKIERINLQNDAKERANKFSKMINLLAIALIAILSLLSLSLYRNNIIRNKSNLLLQEKNNELIIANEKTEKASQARSEFLSIVSHELRTPLNAINGITHLLLEENPKKSQLHYLSSLKFSGNYLTKFINEILEINKMDSNKLEIENITFNLKQLLDDIKNSLNGLAQENNNAFALHIDQNIPNNLKGDPTKLSQIFMNLINNALKFTKDGIVSVTAKATQLDNKNVIVSFEITDTGIGISAEKIETVFDSFSQGSIEINRKYGGTGLGLTIVKKLIEILGGEIKVQSIIDQGSTFFFDLQFEVDQNQLTPEVPMQSYDDATLKNKKILIVEDNKINQMIAKKMLENKDVFCEIIDNGEEAIEAIKSNQYDMVLMDVHLPGINGTIATSKIREFNSEIPIIAITAISLNENREMLLSFGMNDVVTKPFTPEDFYTTIANNFT
jgi:signal transduction histidine kinase/CheY-like chemotaxis protein